MSASNAVIVCPACGGAMLLEGQPIVPPKGKGPTVEMYQCEGEMCQRRAALIFEPEGGLTDEDRSWVEREVARRGAFFPADYTGGSR
jgi:hypothetical protein